MSSSIKSTKDDLDNKNSTTKLKQQHEELMEIKSKTTKNLLTSETEPADFYFTETSPIQIYIQSNIPNKAPWLLQRSNFLVNFERPKEENETPRTYSELPFFTNEVKYPAQFLYELEPYQIYDFFFNKDFFEQTLHRILFFEKKVAVEPNLTGEKRQPQYNQNNIMTMLQLLFTTVYPRTNNVTNTIDEYIRKQTNPINLNRIMDTPTYTYITLERQEYTVMKVIWLNDIFNHPKYLELAEKFINYRNWCITQSKSIQKKIDDNITKIENLIRNFDFGDLLGILKARTPNQRDSTRLTFEQDVFFTNVNTLNKIVNIMNSYRLFILGGKRDTPTFLKSANEFDLEFTPYIGQEVEVKLTEIAGTFPTNQDEIKKAEYAKKFWYYGKIIKKDTDTDATGKKYIVQIFYKKRNNPTTESIEVSISLINIREPILPKILSMEKTELKKVIIEYLREDGKDYGIDFKNEKVTDSNFYSNINNIGKKKPMSRNANIFKSFDSVVTLEEYNKNPQFYRYKIENQEDEIHIANKIKAFIDKNPTDAFLGYLDMLDETYNRVKNNMNFNSRIKIFIEGVIRYHKIILPIKSINDMYLRTYKIDIQHKDISTGDTAAELTTYKNFVNFMTGFVTPKMETANTDLQAFILSYAENIAGENFITLMDVLAPCYSKRKPKCKPIKNEQTKEAMLRYINTSLNYINMTNKEMPQYEIYVHVNFVKGHLDNSNWVGIKCNYNDALLTRKFEGIIDKELNIGDWAVDPAPFVSVDDAIVESSSPETIPMAEAKPISSSKSDIPIAEAVPVKASSPPPPTKRATKKTKGGKWRRKKRATRRRRH